MSIILARLQNRDARKGWLTKDYTSTRGNTYRAGDGRVPSPLTRVDDPAELAELRAFSTQVEVVEVDDEAHLAELLQYEMEMRVRAGGQPVRAEVFGVNVPASSEPAAPRRKLAAFLPPAGTAVATDDAPAAIPGPRAADRAEPRARIDEDGDEVFDPAPIPPPPAAAPDASEPAKATPPAASRKGGRRGRG